MNLLTRLLFVSALCCLCGCREHAQSQGLWPVYETPQLVLTVEEKAQLANIYEQYPELVKKLQRHNNANADILAVHNKRARAHNINRLKSLGVTEEELKALVGHGEETKATD